MDKLDARTDGATLNIVQQNIGKLRECLTILRDHGFNGVLSMECEGQGGPMIEKSLAWLRKTLKELGIKERA